MSEWQPIETAPKDGTEVLLYVCSASVEIIRNGFWDDGDMWEMQGFESKQEKEGWWWPTTSVGQEKYPAYMQPTHWMPVPEPPPIERG